jgi:hypothetical protein
LISATGFSDRKIEASDSFRAMDGWSGKTAVFSDRFYGERRRSPSGRMPPLSQPLSLPPRVRPLPLQHRPIPSGHISSTGDRRGRLARLLLTATLLLALAVNPIGAVIHAWSHLAQVPAGYGKSLHHGSEVCELCAAYSALEHATPAAPLTLEGFAPESPTLFWPEFSPPATRLFHYRQRAPPAAPA